MHQPNDRGTNGEAAKPFGQLEFVVVHPAAPSARGDGSFTPGGRRGVGGDEDSAHWLQERLTACYND